MKRAQLFAEAVAVLCPECGAEQASPCGSLMWMAEDFKTASGKFPCQSCDAKILIAASSKVQFETT